jgi:hypothetical protein
MTVYYVDYTAGSDAAAGTSEGTAWKTLAKVNASTFAAGDSILFKKGETWSNEYLACGQSGSLGNPIRYGAYGLGARPKIKAYVTKTSFTAETVGMFTAYWMTNADGDPGGCFEDGRLMQRRAAKADLASGQWTWDSGSSRLYLRCTDGAAPATHTITVCSQAGGWLDIIGKNHIHVDGLDFEGGFWGAGFIKNTCTGITIRNCGFNNGGSNGLYLDGQWDGSTVMTDILIEDCDAAWNRNAGINAGGRTEGVTLRRFTAHDNAKASNADEHMAGIKAISSAAGHNANGFVIEDCLAYANGSAWCPGSSGSGIFFDTPGSGCVIRRNRCHGNSKTGIFVEFVGSATGGAQILNNLVWLNGNCGIWLYRSCHDCLIAHNVCYDNQWYNLIVDGEPADPLHMDDNRVVNNIALAGPKYPAAASLGAFKGGENSGGRGTGNTYDHNCFGLACADFIGWGDGVSLSTYAAWEAVAGEQHSVEADPAFVDAAGGDFRLAASSPCIAAGINLGAGGPIAAFDHVPYGTSPDVGAFSRLAGATLDFSKPFLGLSFPAGTVAEITLWPTAKTVDELKALTTPG